MPHRMLVAKNITRGNQHRSRPRDSPPRQDACEGRSTQRRKIRKLGGFSARSIPSCTRPSWSSTNSRNDQDATSAASASDLLRVLRVLLWLSSSKTKGKADEDSQQEEVKVERKAPSALDVSGRAFRKDLQAELARCRQRQQYKINPSPPRNSSDQKGLSFQQLAQLRSPKHGLSSCAPTAPTTWWENENGPSKQFLSPSSSSSTLPVSPPPPPSKQSTRQLPPLIPVARRQGHGGLQSCANGAGKRPGGRSVWRGEPARKPGGDGDVDGTKA